MKQRKILYWRKKPGQDRASFSIMKAVLGTDGKRVATPINDGRVKAINKQFSLGVPLEECERMIKEVIASLYKEVGIDFVPHDLENMAVAEKYFKEKYSKRINNRPESVRSMQFDLKRSVKAIGSLSLRTATEEELQVAIDRRFEGNRQRRVVMGIRQLLKFVGRDDVNLQLARRNDDQVRYFSLEEALKIFSAIENPAIRCLAKLGVYCGLRSGEAFWLKPYQLKGLHTLYIDWQLRPDGEQRRPKRGKVRKAFIIKGGLEAVREWFEIPQKFKDEIRKNHKTVPGAIVRACRSVWPNDETKQLNFRDLRHVYAIHLVSRGISTDVIAKLMGNSPDVCVRYYQGFILSDTGVDLVHAILERAATQ